MSYDTKPVIRDDECAPRFYTWSVGNTQVAWLQRLDHPDDGNDRWVGRVELRDGDAVDLTLAPVEPDVGLEFIEATLRGLGYKL